MTEPVVHLSALIGAPLLDSAGEKLGRVDDLVARLGQPGVAPPIVGVRARIGGRSSFVPIDRVERIGPNNVQTSTTKLNLAQFERRPAEVLLRADILDHSLINVGTAKLVTARDVQVVCRDGAWRVDGISTSFGPRLRRALPRAMRGQPGADEAVLAWSELEPLVSHVPTSRLKLGARLGRLHPAQIADLVEAASHEEGEEILEAVSTDKELEADVFEELDEEHQVEFLRERTDAEVAAVLERMASDDAADLILELDQDRRMPILSGLSQRKQLKVKALLGFNPSTAGGLMNPDFVSAPIGGTVGDAILRVRTSEVGAQQISVVCLVDPDGGLVATVSLADLLRNDDERALEELAQSSLPTVPSEADLPEIATLMADYNLVAMPVVDGGGRPIGVVAVDDVLEELLPDDWRRRSGMARA